VFGSVGLLACRTVSITSGRASIQHALSNYPLELTEQESQDLRHVAGSRALPAGDVFRARLILLLAEGRSYAAIKRDLHTTAPSIAQWMQRFLEKHPDGLVENRRPGHRPTAITPQLLARVLAPTQRPLQPLRFHPGWFLHRPRAHFRCFVVSYFGGVLHSAVSRSGSRTRSTCRSS